MDLRYLCFGVFGWFTDCWYCLLGISICVVMGVLLFCLWLVLVVFVCGVLVALLLVCCCAGLWFCRVCFVVADLVCVLIVLVYYFVVCFTCIGCWCLIVCV